MQTIYWKGEKLINCLNNICNLPTGTSDNRERQCTILNEIVHL
jgi:hypothetical protein